MVTSDPGQEYDWLFVTEFPTVVRTAYLVVHNRARAEEIAQESFLQLLRHWDKVRTYDSPQAWVRRVAIRLATRDATRERRRMTLTRRSVQPDQTAPPADARIDSDLMSAIGKLTPRQRAIVVLFYYEDRPMDQIADIIGCSTATGWVHLHKARKALGTLLSEEVDSDVR